MKRKFRLTRSTDVQRVRRLGKSYAHPLVVLIAVPNLLEISRFGVIAGRSVGKAVQRNRAKRLIRAAVQPSLEMMRAGWDVLLVARHPISEATFQDTQAALQNLLKRANLLQDTHGA